jgi:CheY-like chemotaxis protein
MQELTPGCVHHLVCIGQEAVSNAIRHAQPSSIVIHLKYESDALNLSIRDDGRGFYASDRSTSRRGHFGIPVMEERARKLGGTFRLQTSSRAWPYSVLSGHPQIRIIGEAGDGEVGTTMYRTLRPDAVVLDLRLPRVSGFDVIIQLRKEFPNADVYGPFAAAQWLISPKTPVGKNS